MTASGCYTCDSEAGFDQLPPRELIAYDEQWRVAHATGTALPGWLVLVPRRHIMELADLSDAEASSLGSWQLRLARALADVLDAPKTYIAEFGEAPGFHLHFHVVPRPNDLTRELRGPGIFGLLGRADDQQVTAARDELARKLTAHLMA